MKELNTSMTVKKNIRIPVILFNYCDLPLKRYSIPLSLFPTSLHSILPNLLSVDDLLLVKMEVISCEISYLLPFLRPDLSIPLILPELLQSSLPVVMVPFSGWCFSSLHANVCLSFKC